jgi:hypothetical protein
MDARGTAAGRKDGLSFVSAKKRWLQVLARERRDLPDAPKRTGLIAASVQQEKEKSLCFFYSFIAVSGELGKAFPDHSGVKGSARTFSSKTHSAASAFTEVLSFAPVM